MTCSSLLLVHRYHTAQSAVTIGEKSWDLNAALSCKDLIRMGAHPEYLSHILPARNSDHLAGVLEVEKSDADGSTASAFPCTSKAKYDNLKPKDLQRFFVVTLSCTYLVVTHSTRAACILRI